MFLFQIYNFNDVGDNLAVLHFYSNKTSENYIYIIIIIYADVLWVNIYIFTNDTTLVRLPFAIIK